MAGHRRDYVQHLGPSKGPVPYSTEMETIRRHIGALPLGNNSMRDIKGPCPQTYAIDYSRRVKSSGQVDGRTCRGWRTTALSWATLAHTHNTKPTSGQVLHVIWNEQRSGRPNIKHHQHVIVLITFFSIWVPTYESHFVLLWKCSFEGFLYFPM